MEMFFYFAERKKDQILILKKKTDRRERERERTDEKRMTSPVERAAHAVLERQKFNTRDPFQVSVLFVCARNLAVFFSYFNCFFLCFWKETKTSSLCLLRLMMLM